MADLPYDCPLDVHCSYTCDQLLLITLNKSDKEYSPTTMYNDYSINSRLFHWQSQSTTSADSPTGQRYIDHKSRNSHVLLFVRETKSDVCGAAPYTFLGTTDYVSHTGSRPMNIVWQLHQEIPAKFLRKTQQVLFMTGTHCLTASRGVYRQMFTGAFG